MTKYNKEYYLSQEWQVKRGLMLEWSGYKCNRCKSSKDLRVHHKHYRTFGDEMPWDLEVLCDVCHKDEHYIGKPDSEIELVV